MDCSSERLEMDFSLNTTEVKCFSEHYRGRLFPKTLQ